MSETLQELHARAARGDASAQSDLVLAVMQLAHEARMEVDEAATIAEPLARLAAAHGAESDRVTLLGVLLLRAGLMQKMGRPDREAIYMDEIAALSEALIAEGNRDAARTWAAILSGLADDGDETAAARLAALADELGPDVLKEAAFLDRLFNAPAGTA